MTCLYKFKPVYIYWRPNEMIMSHRKSPHIIFTRRLFEPYREDMIINWWILSRKRNGYICERTSLNVATPNSTKRSWLHCTLMELVSITVKQRGLFIYSLGLGESSWSVFRKHFLHIPSLLLLLKQFCWYVASTSIIFTNPYIIR